MLGRDVSLPVGRIRRIDASETVACLGVPERNGVGIGVQPRFIRGRVSGSHHDVTIHRAGLHLGAQPDVSGHQERMQAWWMSAVPPCPVQGCW